MPHACGALYGASSTRAKVAHLQGGRIIKVCEQLSLFIFAFVLAKINVLNLGIAKTGLLNSKCGVESKKHKNCLSKFKETDLSSFMSFFVKPLFLCPSLWRITTNGLRAGVSFLLVQT